MISIPYFYSTVQYIPWEVLEILDSNDSLRLADIYLLDNIGLQTYIQVNIIVLVIILLSLKCKYICFCRDNIADTLHQTTEVFARNVVSHINYLGEIFYVLLNHSVCLPLHLYHRYLQPLVTPLTHILHPVARGL